MRYPGTSLPTWSGPPGACSPRRPTLPSSPNLPPRIRARYQAVFFMTFRLAADAPEHRVDARVGVRQDGAKEPVEFLGGDGVQGHPTGQVHVAGLVDGERDAVHPRVALEQPGPQLLAPLVRLAHHERLDP